MADSTRAVLAHRGTEPETIFGGIDALKFRSSMTLFETVAGDVDVFACALDCFYGGERDDRTLRLLAIAKA